MVHTHVNTHTVHTHTHTHCGHRHASGLKIIDQKNPSSRLELADFQPKSPSCCHYFNIFSSNKSTVFTWLIKVE